MIIQPLVHFMIDLYFSLQLSPPLMAAGSVLTSVSLFVNKITHK